MKKTRARTRTVGDKLVHCVGDLARDNVGPALLAAAAGASDSAAAAREQRQKRAAGDGGEALERRLAELAVRHLWCETWCCVCACWLDSVV